jgi:hypothetical protein
MARAIRKPVLAVFVSEQKSIEPIPRLDPFQINYRTAGTIEYRKAPGLEFRAPILVRLLIDVEPATLPGTSGGKHDEVAMPTEVIDQSLRVSFRNVFGYFKAHYEFKALLEVKRLRYVNRPESACGDGQCFSRNVVPVHTYDFLDSYPTPFREPYARPAADVKYRRWRCSIESNLNDGI